VATPSFHAGLLQVLDRAGQTSMTEACRTFGVSRTTYYRWAGRAQRYGLVALVPKTRRPPVMPTAAPPTSSASRGGRPADPGRPPVGRPPGRPWVRLSPSGVQKLLRRHRLGRRAQRMTALARPTSDSEHHRRTARRGVDRSLKEAILCAPCLASRERSRRRSWTSGSLRGAGPRWVSGHCPSATCWEEQASASEGDVWESGIPIRSSTDNTWRSSPPVG
jgi:hypothetical protein